MSKQSLSCEEIDKQDLVEQFVSGKIPETLRKAFEEHLANCKIHARAVMLETAIQHGVRDYARDELKKRIKSGGKKKSGENTGVIILRFAAIFLVVILLPIILLHILNQKESVELVQQLPIETTRIDSTSEVERNEPRPLPESEEMKRGKKTVASVRMKVNNQDDSSGSGTAQIDIEAVSGSDAGGKGSSMISFSSSNNAKVKALPGTSNFLKQPGVASSDTCMKNPIFQKILNQNELLLQNYFRTLNSPPTRIDLTLTILPPGSVASINIRSISQPLPLLEDSLKRSVSHLSFPAVKDTCLINKTYIFGK